MTLIFTLSGGIAFAVACASIWFAFQRPGFYVGLAAIALKAALPAILKRKSPEEEAKWRDRIARGQSGEVDKWGREKGHDK